MSQKKWPNINWIVLAAIVMGGLFFLSLNAKITEKIFRDVEDQVENYESSEESDYNDVDEDAGDDEAYGE